MNIKKLIPYDEYILKTNLSFSEVKNRIRKNVVPVRSMQSYFFEGTNKLFEGYVLDSSFKIDRLINGRKSFLPIIEGHIFIKDNKTHIKIYAKTLYWRIIVFFFVGIFFYFSISFFNKIFPEKSNPLMPFIISILLYFVTLISFQVMNKKTKSFFIKLLEAEVIKI